GGGRLPAPRGERRDFSRVVFARWCRISLGRCPRLVESLYIRNRGVDRRAFEARERVLLDGGERSVQWLVAICIEIGVAGVVMSGVETAQPRPRQLGYVLWIAAGDACVSETWKQCAAEVLLHCGLRRRQSSLHLVEDDALETKSARGVGRVLEFESDAFLLEGILRQQREEDRVEVNLQKIHVILLIPSTEGIRRGISAGQRVHEGRQRPPGHREEGIADRKAFRPSEHDVLEDVRYASRVLGHGGKRNRECVVVVGAFDVNVPGTCSLMDELDKGSIEPLQGLATHDRVSAD